MSKDNNTAADFLARDLQEALIRASDAERALAEERALVAELRRSPMALYRIAAARAEAAEATLARVRDLALEWDGKADDGADEYPREARVWAADARELLALLDGL